VLSVSCVEGIVEVNVHFVHFMVERCLYWALGVLFLRQIEVGLVYNSVSMDDPEYAEILLAIQSGL
jgi:hypothetical protein